ncbi:MAG: DUF4468 domain-containing protein [Bacteroidaceae bacterium]|nr:DUF4468 domain-containing protein [Bacteroidaceae bacterium]MCQ2244980.1 DUF4468 domain-containing protein [Bacteroidaceae bacterium]
MKKFASILAIAIAFIFSATSVNAQMISQTNLESYAKAQYGKSWEKSAVKQLAEGSTLDNTGNMVFTKEINAPQLTKDELYYEMANWFIANYNNAIQFADKEQGLIIARPYIENIARYAGGFNAYDISICPTVRAQVKDGKVDVTYTLGDYNVVVEKGGGNTAAGIGIGLTAAAVTGAIVDASTPRKTYVEHRDYGHGFHSTTVCRTYRPRTTFSDALLVSCIADAALSSGHAKGETWQIANCYPFASKDSHKKTSSKAFVMANIYSQVVMENIQAAINQCNEVYAMK